MDSDQNQKYSPKQTARFSIESEGSAAFVRKKESKVLNEKSHRVSSFHFSFCFSISITQIYYILFCQSCVFELQIYNIFNFPLTHFSFACYYYGYTYIHIYIMAPSHWCQSTRSSHNKFFSLLLILQIFRHNFQNNFNTFIYIFLLVFFILERNEKIDRRKFVKMGSRLICKIKQKKKRKRKQKIKIGKKIGKNR